MKFTQKFALIVLCCVLISPASAQATESTDQVVAVKPMIIAGNSIVESEELLSLTFTHPVDTNKKEVRFECPRKVKTESKTFPCGKWLDLSEFTGYISFVNTLKKEKKVTIKYRVRTDTQIKNAQSVAVTVKPFSKTATAIFSLKNVPQYGFADNSEAYISTSIVVGGNIGTVTSWSLTPTCPKGVTLVLSGKGDEPNKDICGEVFKYNSSHHLTINNENVVLRAGAANGNDKKSSVKYSLKAYDAKGKMIGTDVDTVELDPKRSTETVAVPISIKNEPLYGPDGSNAYISTSIGAGLNNSKVTSWGLTMNCSEGVTLIIPSKTDEPGQNVCGKTLYYYSSHYFNINNETVVLRAGAVNRNNVPASVTYSLWAYDANGQVIGRDAETITLKAQ